MFDNKPTTSAASVKAVAGLSLSDVSYTQRDGFWYIWQIFDPDKHQLSELDSYVVPKENNLVADPDNGVIYRVKKVDDMNGLKSELVIWNIMNQTESNTVDQDWIFGLREGPGLGEALLSIDYSVRPNVARVDATIMRPGAAYAMLYHGSNLGDDKSIIGVQYDKTGNLIKKQVPVKLAAINDITNKNIMTTDSFSVTLNGETLSNGSRCTLVFFDEGGNYIPPYQPVFVQHSAYMANHQVGVRYVMGIELISPWFTNINDPKRIVVPINTNIRDIEFRAVVHYSNGDAVEMAVNGSKFNLMGLNEHRPTYPGQQSELTLTYYLDADEQFYLAKPGTPNHISEVYVAEAGQVSGVYSPKLYTFPYWDKAISGYNLIQYMYDLNRETRIQVTDITKYNEVSPVYRPTQYGMEQSLVFNVNMKDVNASNQPVTFKQRTDISLLGDVNSATDKWSVRFTQGKPDYVAKRLVPKNNGTKTTFKIDNGYANVDEWLKGMYLAVDPAMDTWHEDTPPTPDAFYLVSIAGKSYRYNVADWNKDLSIDVQFGNGETWLIAWVLRNKDGSEQQLAMSGVVVKS